jgi:hypothetical protein
LSQGITVISYNIDLFKQFIYKNQVNSLVCLNPAVSLPNKPPPDFFAPYTGAIYTYPSDNLANAYNKTSNLISCYISILYDVSPQQLQDYIIS